MARSTNPRAAALVAAQLIEGLSTQDDEMEVVPTARPPPPPPARPPAAAAAAAATCESLVSMNGACVGGCVVSRALPRSRPHPPRAFRSEPLPVQDVQLGVRPVDGPHRVVGSRRAHLHRPQAGRHGACRTRLPAPRGRAVVGGNAASPWSAVFVGALAPASCPFPWPACAARPVALQAASTAASEVAATLLVLCTQRRLTRAPARDAGARDSAPRVQALQLRVVRAVRGGTDGERRSAAGGPPQTPTRLDTGRRPPRRLPSRTRALPAPRTGGEGRSAVATPRVVHRRSLGLRRVFHPSQAAEQLRLPQVPHGPVRVRGGGVRAWRAGGAENDEAARRAAHLLLPQARRRPRARRRRRLGRRAGRGGAIRADGGRRRRRRRRPVR